MEDLRRKIFGEFGIERKIIFFGSYNKSSFSSREYRRKFVYNFYRCNIVSIRACLLNAHIYNRIDLEHEIVHAAFAVHEVFCFGRDEIRGAVSPTIISSLRRRARIARSRDVLSR